MLGRNAADGGGLLIILGAGASHNSAPYHMADVQRVDESWRPPLADQLFERPEFQATLSKRRLPLAIVTPDGTWHQIHELHKDTADEECARRAADIFALYSDGYQVVGVDCHV